MTGTRADRGVDQAETAVIDHDAFCDHYLSRAPSQLPGRSPAALVDLAEDHLAFGRQRPDGTTMIRICPPVDDVTAIEIVSADALFLIDSVRAELQRSGRHVRRLLYPQLVVERDADGTLTRVHDLDDAADVPPGAMTESWLYIEVDAIPAGLTESVTARLQKVVEDVHHFSTDARAMHDLMGSLADQLAAQPGLADVDTSDETAKLLRWLSAGNLLLLGHTQFPATDLINPNATGRHTLGVLRGDAQISPTELIPALRSGAPLVIFKSPLIATVRRSARYDCVTVVTQEPEGQIVHVFLGLLAQDEDGLLQAVPVVRRRVAEILLRAGVRRDSHTGRQLMGALRTLPRDELLEAPTADLLRLSQLVAERAERGGVGVFARTHLNRDFVTVLVYFPADRYGPEVRRRISATITGRWPGEVVARENRITETGLARMQFLIALRPGNPMPSVDRARVEAEVADIIRRWSDDLDDLLRISVDDETADTMMRRYGEAFDESYKEDFRPSTAVEDIETLERIAGGDGLDFRMYVPPADDPADRRLKVYRTGTSVSLARALPIFSQMGIEVLDERPYEIGRSDTIAWIYDFGLKLPPGVDLDAERTTDVLDALGLLWRDQLEQDGFNALVPRAGLTWWQANILRAYSKYLRQAGTTFSQGYIEQALIDNPSIARQLVAHFEARFDPDQAGPVDSTIVEQITDELADVASLDQDRILRSLLAMISATLRTNAYRCDEAGARRTALAVKLDPRQVPGLPAPRPRFEIWVYSPRVEGVHLRFGAVARGGLRWSDRREDFRTEILGLVKAQTVKNAVIVPTGSKGGFVGKRLPDPTADREGWLAEGIACYRTFISCLLDVTDNYDATDRSRVIHPPQTRCYDGDDPYLVVAADKGTASFSDIANGISADYGFWLGDAFASGGSVGYDHKAMGITARGAWESVKYHFRELGLNIQAENVTVAGIGDMSGDVFGNGMLLSEHIQLVAAFDHRHIFLDPTPDVAASFAERRRLFDLPRSSWADYDTTLISRGGGVFPRTKKSIPVTPEMATLLDLTATTVTPAELIHAILLARVDLLWNGGIGTYVKAATESNAAAGDKANDAVRVDGAQLRCRVVGEGGNLGLTQLGRIEYARAGGRINTDAIDNSAGVDTSDHEVNIKILLDRAVMAGELTRAERNEVLASVTDEVGALVLRDNYEQNVLLGMARTLSPSLASVHLRFIGALEKAGELDRELEFLPSDREFGLRESSGRGLCSPENSVLIAYAKIALSRRISDSTLPEDPWFQRALVHYFPAPIAERFAADLPSHPLAHEIVTTCVVNDMINRGGTTFVYRVSEETGTDAASVARAYTVVREVFDLERLWAEIEALDNVVSTTAQHAAYQEIRRLIDRATRWMIENRAPMDDVASEIERFRPLVAQLSPGIPALLRGGERDTLQAETERLIGVGLPAELAGRLAELLNAYLLLDVVEIADGRPEDPAEIGALHYALSERFSIDEMLTRVTELPRSDRWSTLARAAMRHDVYDALSSITRAVLKATTAMPGEAVDVRVDEWEFANTARIDRARRTLREALSREGVDLATLSVALRVMRALPAG